MVGAVGEVIDRLTLPAREKRQLEERGGPLSLGSRGGGGPGKLVAAIVAAAGDAGVRLDRPRGDVHDAAHPLRYFPLSGFAGNRPGRLRGGEERGKNGGGDF